VSTPWRLKIPGALTRLLIWAALLTIWEMAYRHWQWRTDIYPAPSQVLEALLNFFGLSLTGNPPAAGSALHRFFHSDGLEANIVSILRLIIGFAISFGLGAIFGGMMWRWTAVDRFFGPVFLGMQTLPSVCWAPLAVLVGLDEKGILFVLVMGSACGIAVAMRDGLRTIPPLYRRAGLMLGARKWRLYRYVLLPAALPALASTLRQGFGYAWRSLMGAEMILPAQNQGLGRLLADAQGNSIEQGVAIILIMIVIGILADRFAFAPLERRVHQRFGLEASP
jgi:NitT/TauT family transport system permease protein